MPSTRPACSAPRAATTARWKSAAFPPGRRCRRIRIWRWAGAGISSSPGFWCSMGSSISRTLSLSRHIRDLWPSLADLRAIPHAVVEHLQLRFPTGDEALRYNVLQKLAYLSVVIAFPILILAGLTMSPAVNAAFPWLLTLFHGRQAARAVHFLLAAYLVLFLIVHLVMVVLSGPDQQHALHDHRPLSDQGDLSDERRASHPPGARRGSAAASFSSASESAPPPRRSRPAASTPARPRCSTFWRKPRR